MNVERTQIHGNPWLAATLAVVAASMVLFVYAAVWRHSGELSHGYAAYYTSARLVLNGADPSAFYDNRWFMDQTIRLGFGETPDIYNVNPPTMSFILMPLIWLSPVWADIIWSLANVAFLAIAVVFLFRTLDAAGFELGWAGDHGKNDSADHAYEAATRLLPWLLIAVTLLYSPIYFNFRFGQAYILVLMLMSIAFWAFVTRRDGWLGGALGLMLLLKSAGALLWLALLFDRRFRAVGWGLMTIVIGIVAASPLLGMRVWWEYVQRLPGLTDRPSTGVIAYQTMSSIIHHLVRKEEAFSPQPIINVPWLAQPLSTLASVALVLAAVSVGWVLTRNVPERRGRLVRFSLLLCLAVPLQPVGEQHNYTIMLPAVFVAIALVFDGARLSSEWGVRGELVRLTALTGVLLLMVPLPFLATSLQTGWRAFFAYPKLYGALLLASTMAIYLVSEPSTWMELIRTRFDAVRQWRPALRSESVARS